MNGQQALKSMLALAKKHATNITRRRMGARQTTLVAAYDELVQTQTPQTRFDAPETVILPGGWGVIGRHSYNRNKLFFVQGYGQEG
jgi:hypothetical protein